MLDVMTPSRASLAPTGVLGDTKSATTFENRCIPFAITWVLRHPAQRFRPGIAATLAASAAYARVFGPFGHTQVLPQRAHHVGQRRRRIIDADVDVIQRHITMIRFK